MHPFIGKSLVTLALSLCVLACTREPSSETHEPAVKPGPPVQGVLEDSGDSAKPGDIQLTLTVTPEVSGSLTVKWNTPDGVTLIEAPDTERQASEGVPEVFHGHFVADDSVSGAITASVRIESGGGVFGDIYSFAIGSGPSYEVPIDGQVVEEKSTGEKYFQIEGKTVVDGKDAN